MKDDTAEILFQSFLQEAIMNSSGMGRDIHSLTSSIQHYLCLPRWCCLPSKVPWRMVLGRLLRHVTCLNHAKVSISWQLPEEVPVGQHGSWSCSAPTAEGPEGPEGPVAQSLVFSKRNVSEVKFSLKRTCLKTSMIGYTVTNSLPLTRCQNLVT